MWVCLGETWVGWERRGKAGRDVGRPGETWGGWERPGEDGRDVASLRETWVGCVQVVGGLCNVWY